MISKTHVLLIAGIILTAGMVTLSAALPGSMPGSEYDNKDIPYAQNALTPEKLWQLNRIGAPEPSPDGSRVIFPVTEYDIDSNSSETNLYLHSFERDEPRRFTSQGSDRQPAWSPDGTRIAFVSGRGGSPAQIYVIPADGGEAIRITEMPVSVSAPKWFPDGRHIAFSASVLPGYGGDFDKLEEMIREQNNQKVSAKVTEHRIYRHWDRWLTDGRYPRLFKLDVETGEVTDLMPGSRNYFAMMGAPEYDISPDGSEIAVSANSNPPPYEYLNYDIFLIPTDGSGDLINITEHNPANDLSPAYSPDGNTLLYGKRRSTDFYADRVRLVFYDRNTGVRNVVEEVVHAGIDLSPSGFVWADDSRELYFSAQDRGNTSLFSYDVRRDRTREIYRGGTNTGAALAGNRLVFVHRSLKQAPELFRIQPNGRNLSRVTEMNREIMEDTRLGRVENVTYEGAKGVDVQMFVVYPPDFDEEKTWPLLVQIHGGPHGIFGDDFHFRWNAQLFAAPGYVVAMPNFHGSTSFGQDFAKSIHGAHSELPYRDIMKATDYMEQKAYIDPERTAAAGGSYGGYMVSWIAGHTDRYQALINHAGVYNIMTQFAADVTYHREAAYSGAPWDGLEQLQQWNPAVHAENFSTPMLILHGELDYRVPVTHGLEVYGVYKGLGLDARLVYYPDENHWILTPQNSIHWFGEFHRWLLRYIGSGYDN
ncbi:S9 family peptidase [Balneolales bacterium ANBcel1]|nr:S9 family peptidase [Balneolales bacterium ANBcel1]